MLTASLRFPCAALTLTIAVIAGCGKKPAATPQPTPAPAATPAPSGKEGHGATTALGEKTAGVYVIKASRDGDVTPGKDVPITVVELRGELDVERQLARISRRDDREFQLSDDLINVEWSGLFVRMRRCEIKRLTLDRLRNRDGSAHCVQ